MLCHSKQKKKNKQTKVANTCVIGSIEFQLWFDPKFFLFDVNYMLSDINFTYGNHSINQDSAHLPIGIKMLRPISGYLVRELNCDVIRN